MDLPLTAHALAPMIVFDLDDTLAPSKTRIDPSMARLLADLLDRTQVCIISGGRFEQFEAQVLVALADVPHLDRLHLMPTCGTRYLRHVAGDWAEIYAEVLSADEKVAAISVITEGAKALGLWSEQSWGDIIEDRGSQITFSALGQSAPVEEKKDWDPDGTKKEALRAFAAERLPGLEVRSGGSTSVDITRLGIDKAFGVRHLEEETGIPFRDYLFIGDRLDEGGNDYPVKAMGVPSIAVTDWKDTRDLLQTLLYGAYSTEGAHR